MDTGAPGKAPDRDEASNAGEASGNGEAPARDEVGSHFPLHDRAKAAAARESLRARGLLEENDNDTVEGPNPVGPPSVRCLRNCGLLFHTRMDMLRHAVLADRHSYCPGCEELFENDHDLLAHEMKDAKIEHWRCPLCGEYCIRQSALRNHVRSSHPPVRYGKPKCPGCGKLFEFGSQHMTHMRTNECGSGIVAEVMEQMRRMYERRMQEHEAHIAKLLNDLKIQEVTIAASSPSTGSAPADTPERGKNHSDSDTDIDLDDLINQNRQT
ncbi:hypothetical protein N7532_005104 [Penicillium argentinense]|uniref:C2H2-type domain-containing protein n=1 Tax=Penicillium argentinense TaxID=1131581 RepID=A0A9W9FD97_9EURO|nr:uncharacterized protein N7532_005104 [Penicillium argentinense]KAJ5098103.1 hypothetical protein N7532_005104 [Penicillium argentinense]